MLDNTTFNYIKSLQFFDEVEKRFSYIVCNKDSYSIVIDFSIKPDSEGFSAEILKNDVRISDYKLLTIQGLYDALHEFIHIIKDDDSKEYSFDEYQLWTDKTASYPNSGKGNYVYPTLGLAGEGGEVCEKIKKLIRDKNGVVTEEFKQEIAKEMGDQYWYLARLGKELGLKTSHIINLNVKKLEDRLERNVIKGSGDNR